MKYSAKYFDGVSSRPTSVELEIIQGKIFLQDDEAALHEYWNIEECIVDSVNSSNSVTLKYGEFPYQVLEARGSDAQSLLKEIEPYHSSLSTVHNKVLRWSPVKIMSIGLLSLGVSLVFYVGYLSPWIGEQAVKIIPKRIEIAAGKKMMSQFLGFGLASTDEKKTIQIQAFFEALQFDSPYPIEVRVIDDPTVNAFAAPGGQIVVYQGIIDETDNWEQLAGLLAHELAHVNERHSFKIITRSMSNYLIFSVLTGDVAGSSTVILENLNSLRELSYSRDFEKEADLSGLSYLKASKIRPKAMSELFQILLEQTPDLSEHIDMDKLEFLSSHPLSQNRIAYIEEQIEAGRAFDYEPLANHEAESIWYCLKEGLQTEQDVIEEEIDLEGFELEKVED